MFCAVFASTAPGKWHSMSSSRSRSAGKSDAAIENAGNSSLTIDSSVSGERHALHSSLTASYLAGVNRSAGTDVVRLALVRDAEIAVVGVHVPLFVNVQAGAPLIKMHLVFTDGGESRAGGQVLSQAGFVEERMRVKSIQVIEVLLQTGPNQCLAPLIMVMGDEVLAPVGPTRAWPA